MNKLLRRLLPLLAAVLVLGMAFAVTAHAEGDPTEEPGSKWVECADCGGTGLCMTCYGHDTECEDCGGSGECASCEGSG